MAKIAIIGAGHVGATLAYGLILSGLVSEIVLVDKDRGRADGEALDLAHAVPFGRPVRIRSGAPADIAGSLVSVIAAGANQHPGETRLDLLDRNSGIIRSVAAQVASINPQGIIVVATNPVDVLSRLAFEESGLPAGRVLGSGTILDTARLRHLIGQQFGIDPRNVHANVVGEHGDSSVICWSTVSIGGVALPDLAAARQIAFGADVRRRIEEQTRAAAYVIVQGKGSTYYAIASGLARLIEAILRDQNSVLTVSTMARPDLELPTADGVWLGLPAIVGASGLVETLPLALDEAERAGLIRSVEVLRAAYDRQRKRPC